MLDIFIIMWYNYKCQGEGYKNLNKKVFIKTLKKVLTSFKKYVIINITKVH